MWKQTCDSYTKQSAWVFFSVILSLGQQEVAQLGAVVLPQAASHLGRLVMVPHHFAL